MNPNSPHKGEVPYLAIALEYDPSAAAPPSYTGWPDPNEAEWFRQRYRHHYQRCFKCTDEQADDAMKRVDYLIGKGIVPLKAWDRIYAETDNPKTGDSSG